MDVIAYFNGFFFIPQEIFNKTYDTHIEELRAFRAYEEDLMMVRHHNLIYNAGKASFTRKICDKSDMSLHKKRILLNGLSPPTESVTTKSAMDVPTFKKSPIHWDWRKHGLHWMEVKDQGTCGCCWAIVSADALSAAVFIKSGNKIRFSEQNLVDCNRNEETGNWGCEGGFFEGAFKYIIGNNGIMDYDSYPYEGREGKCRFNESLSFNSSVIRLISYVTLPPNNETLLKDAVYNMPIAIGMNGNCESFFTYSEGIYYDRECNSDNLTHAVLLVGYGTDSIFGDYWIAKNSWGE